MSKYDPADYSTYIGEPTKCNGCGWKGDPEQEGSYHPEISAKEEEVAWFCGECDDCDHEERVRWGDED